MNKYEQKTTANIESIDIWENNPGQYNDSKIARINFKFPCKWTTMTIYELKVLLEKWIICEEARYPPSKGFRGRELLKEEIDKVFKETPTQ